MPWQALGRDACLTKQLCLLTTGLGTDSPKFLNGFRPVFNFDILCNRAIFTLLQLYLVRVPFTQSAMIVVFVGVVLSLFSSELQWLVSSLKAPSPKIISALITITVIQEEAQAWLHDECKYQFNFIPLLEGLQYFFPAPSSYSLPHWSSEEGI